eukprot:GHVL01035817.1.p1 GENE.GHVL01035817.1~~GHVL01035817.1.p1  ORF type:complete len:164 (+),score=35.23 GHVL01035817.1:139-630(+)
MKNHIESLKHDKVIPDNSLCICGGADEVNNKYLTAANELQVLRRDNVDMKNQIKNLKEILLLESKGDAEKVEKAANGDFRDWQGLTEEVDNLKEKIKKLKKKKGTEESTFREDMTSRKKAVSSLEEQVEVLNTEKVALLTKVDVARARTVTLEVTLLYHIIIN